MKLYEIKQLYNDTIEQMLEDNTFDGNLLHELDGEFRDKALACTAYISNLDAEIKAIKDAEARMTERRKSKENEITRLKSYLLNNMINTGIDKVENAQFKVSIRSNPPSVNILDEAVIPAEFKREVITVKVDKTAIKKAGGCNGVEIVRNKSLSIK